MLGIRYVPLTAGVVSVELQPHLVAEVDTSVTPPSSGKLGQSLFTLVKDFHQWYTECRPYSLQK